MVKSITLLFALFLSFSTLLSCSDDKSKAKVAEKLDAAVAEIVSSDYPKPNESEVKISAQTWMTSNLDVEKFNNGDLIPQAKNDDEWKLAGEQKKPIWAFYDYDEANGKKFGKLYNFYVVNDKRGIAPKGWHVPSRTDWGNLMNFLGGENTAGKKLKNSKGWSKNGNGTNEVGFFGLPGGQSHFLGGGQGIGQYANWWSSTVKDAEAAYAPSLSHDKESLILFNPRKEYGFSVRLIKD